MKEQKPAKLISLAVSMERILEMQKDARDPKRKDIRAMGFEEVEGPSGLMYWQGGARSIPEWLK